MKLDAEMNDPLCRSRATGSRAVAVSTGGLMLLHCCMLAYSASRQSPTALEPAQLAAGLASWQLGRFDLYWVNPPLVRMIAALPALALGCDTDWSSISDVPGARPEFTVGRDFVRANGRRAVRLIVYGRWSCIPFSVLGAWCIFVWARALYGPVAGLAAIAFYVADPNVLAHAQLITTDCACWSCGVCAGYCFWRWLKSPTWLGAFVAGATLGVASSAKLTWLLLFCLWPALWLMERIMSTACHWRRGKRNRSADHATASETAQHAAPNWFAACQLIAILAVAVYVVNLPYAFRGSCTRLRDFTFVSRLLAGRGGTSVSRNRFATSWVGTMPVPLPADLVHGLDSQMKDFERGADPPVASFLRGTWQFGGWWYYYLYGLLVKVPAGSWIALVAVIAARAAGWSAPASVFDEMVMLAPGIAVVAVASSQLEFNMHLRYVFPLVPVWALFIAQLACLRSPSCRHLAGGTVVLSLAANVAATASIYPRQLAYFNQIAGGERNGYAHLLGSSFDWGQDFLAVADHVTSCWPEARVGCVAMLPYLPRDVHVDVELLSPDWAVRNALAHDRRAEDAVGAASFDYVIIGIAASADPGGPFRGTYEAAQALVARAEAEWCGHEIDSLSRCYRLLRFRRPRRDAVTR